MKVHSTRIEGCKVIEFDHHIDPRGVFQEAFNQERFGAFGLPTEWAQDNATISFKHSLRGLHLQRNNPQGKLIRCFGGEVFDVCVDLRPESPSFMQWEGIFLNWERPLGFYVPPGCAHGFFVTAEAAMVYYKCTTLWDRESDGGIAWNDAQLRIEWPIPRDVRPIISPRDQALPCARDYLAQER